jgi:hypothetical protein
MWKLKLKSIYKHCKSCSSSHTEHSKIGFAIFWFFYDLIWVLQVTGPKGEKLQNLLLLWPLESLKLHTYALQSSRKDPGGFWASQPYPPAAGQARRRRGRAGGGEQARGMIDWAHMWTIRGGSSTREDPVDGRWRDRDGAAAAAWIPVNWGWG